MRVLSPGRRWYAAATQPNRESLAASQLKIQKFEIFFPKQLKTARHARKTIDRVVSFFPGYLFVALDLHVDRWRLVNGTIGVRSLVMHGERPQAVPCGVIENLREMTDESGFFHPVEQLHCGDSVRVLNGPMADMFGCIDRFDGNHRVRLLLNMLHGQIPIVIDRSNIVSR